MRQRPLQFNTLHIPRNGLRFPLADYYRKQAFSGVIDKQHQKLVCRWIRRNAVYSYLYYIVAGHTIILKLFHH
jgi:hypothetical protein